MLYQFILFNELPLYVTTENCYFYGNKFDLTLTDFDFDYLIPWMLRYISYQALHKLFKNGIILWRHRKLLFQQIIVVDAM